LAARVNTAGVNLTPTVAAAVGSFPSTAGTQWPGGLGVCDVAGTFGGTSATLEYQGPNGSTWLTVKAMDSAGVQTAVALTASGSIGFILPPCLIRLTLTGGTPSALYGTANRVPE
jgi:hypothetical protein